MCVKGQLWQTDPSPYLCVLAIDSNTSENKMAVATLMFIQIHT